MSTLRAVIAAVTFSLLFVPSAPAPFAQPGLAASAWAELHESRARLVAGRARSDNGSYFAGLEIVLGDGWKTYWRMPGDAGVPPSFDWTGSTNIAAITVRYPAPLRMPEAGGESIGYKAAVLLPIEVTPKDATKPIGLKLALEFGICREICIPATGAFDLAIPAGPAGAAPPEIAAALERVPRQQQSRRKNDPEIKRIAIDAGAPSPRLTIDAVFGDTKNPDVFVEAPEGLYVPLPKRVASADATGIISFQTDLGRDLAQDLKGKTLTVTLVSDAGASEAQWRVP
jgi:DsbC/DsbD-like thiol-disulfide interchange protein